MYTMLIAEDELAAREGLLTQIDWEALGIRVCGLAENGSIAMTMMESEQPDILLTDIQMPLKDGIAVVQEIRDRGWNTACVILTGFSDFTYAQSAIRLEVFDFIVKPLRALEIKQTFQRLVHHLHEKRELAADQSGLKRQLRENAQVLKAERLSKWLLTPRQPGEQRIELMQQLLFRLLPGPMIAISFQFDSKSLSRLQLSETDLTLIRYAATNIIEESIAPIVGECCEWVEIDSMIVLVLNPQPNQAEYELREPLKVLQQNLESFLKIYVSIGISTCKPSVDDLYEAYQESMSALKQSFFHGTGGIYFYHELPADGATEWSSAADVPLQSLESSIVEALRAGDYAEALNRTDKWFEYFQSHTLRSRTEVNLQTLSLLACLLGLAKEQPQSSKDWQPKLLNLAHQVQQIETLEDLAGLVAQVIQQYVESSPTRKAPRHKVQQIQEYIAAHYESNDLSLASVAKEFFISSGYLSMSFKQDLGINFLDYVHQYRVEQSKLLLKNGEMKIQSIAKAVGYCDEAHFSKTFKKWTGMAPSQYQKSQLLQ